MFRIFVVVGWGVVCHLLLVGVFFLVFEFWFVLAFVLGFWLSLVRVFDGVVVCVGVFLLMYGLLSWCLSFVLGFVLVCLFCIFW